MRRRPAPHRCRRSAMAGCAVVAFPTQAAPVLCAGAISPYPDQRSAEVLRFFCEANRQSPKRLDQLVGALRLEPVLTTPVGALSKGYRRRLLLALGLLAPLPLLLM